jgi:hypothetical protein
MRSPNVADHHAYRAARWPFCGTHSPPMTLTHENKESTICHQGLSHNRSIVHLCSAAWLPFRGDAP